MEPAQTPTAFFFLPVTAAYAAACLLYWAFEAKLWPRPAAPNTAQPRLDFALAVAACAGVLGMGQLYRLGCLIPAPANRYAAALVWMLNNALIFSPLLAVLAIRRQGLGTVFLSGRGLPAKVGFGMLAAALGVLTFVALRGEWARLAGIAALSFSLKSLQNFFAVFMEGFALAFLFVRLRWISGRWVAIGIPCLLFAFAHVPGMMADGRSLFHILSFSCVTAGITAFVLYTLDRSKDIVWLGLVHFFVDAAAGAF